MAQSHCLATTQQTTGVCAIRPVERDNSRRKPDMGIRGHGFALMAPGYLLRISDPVIGVEC